MVSKRFDIFPTEDGRFVGKLVSGLCWKNDGVHQITEDSEKLILRKKYIIRKCECKLCKEVEDV